MLPTDFPKLPGIYKIFFLDPTHFYIGSTFSLQKRFRDHRNDLRRKCHRNEKLQRAWNKYGEEAFHFEIVELVASLDVLIEREQYYLDALKPYYNICPTAQSTRGVKRSAEIRAKLSAAHKGQTPPNKGVPMSPESKAKLSAAKKGKPGGTKGRKLSEEHKRHLSEVNKGKPLSEECMRRSKTPEALAKMSATKRGKPSPKKGVPMTPEAHERFLAKRNATMAVKGKQTPPWLGKKRTPEMNKKVSDSLLSRTPEQKAQARAKQRETVLNRTPEEQAQTREKRRIASSGKPSPRKGIPLSPEERALTLEKRRATRATKTPEQLAASIEKQRATKRNKSAEEKKQTVEKWRKTREANRIRQQQVIQTSLWDDESAS